MSTNPSQPELKWNRYDVIVAALVALLAVAVALWFYLPKVRSGETTVVISAGGQETERVRLSDFSGTTVDFWRARQASFDMVLVTEDGRVLYTPGLKDCFDETEGSGYVYQPLAA